MLFEQCAILDGQLWFHNFQNLGGGEEIPLAQKNINKEI